MNRNEHAIATAAGNLRRVEGVDVAVRVVDGRVWAKWWPSSNPECEAVADWRLIPQPRRQMWERP